MIVMMRVLVWLFNIQHVFCVCYPIAMGRYCLTLPLSPSLPAGLQAHVAPGWKGNEMLKIGHKHFIAGVASLSIGLSALAPAPAQAGNRGAETALAAIVGLAVVGAIVASERDKKKRRRAAREAEAARHAEAAREAARQQERLQARPLPQRVNRKLLPEQCLRRYGEGDDRIRLLGARCMSRHYAYVDTLPLRCERRVWTERGIREGYSTRCLTRRGYQVARH